MVKGVEGVSIVNLQHPLAIGRDGGISEDALDSMNDVLTSVWVPTPC